MSKTAIITGASGNMGKAVVRKFIEEGYQVIGTVIPNDKSELNFPPDKFEKAVVDLMKEEDAQQFVNDILAKHKTIDAAILTVGGFAMGKVAETKTSDISKQIQLNFETAYNTARPIFLQMISQGFGRIFLIGSKPGLDAHNGKGMVAYSLAKSLNFRLAEILNDEAKGTDVVVSVVVPSTIDTPQNRKSMPDADPNKWVKPEAIAEVIYFYSSAGSAVLREPIIKVYNKA